MNQEQREKLLLTLRQDQGRRSSAWGHGGSIKSPGRHPKPVTLPKMPWHDQDDKENTR